jgi:hypothetical protein
MITKGTALREQYGPLKLYLVNTLKMRFLSISFSDDYLDLSVESLYILLSLFTSLA